MVKIAEPIESLEYYNNAIEQCQNRAKYATREIDELRSRIAYLEDQYIWAIEDLEYLRQESIKDYPEYYQRG